MRPDKLTVKSQEAIERARSLAATHGQQSIDPLHLLLSLLSEEEGAVAPVLDKLGADRARMAKETEAAIDRLAKVSGASAGQFMSQELAATFDRAEAEATRLKDEY